MIKSRDLLFLVSVAFTDIANATELPFVISVEKKNTAMVNVFGRSPSHKTSSNGIELELSGIEESECRPYGRKSSARAASSVKILSQSRDDLSLELEAAAYTHGGHYRTCVDCYKNNCVIIAGNDTGAKAIISTSARIVIEFTKEYMASNYTLQVSGTYSGVDPSITLSSYKGDKQELNLSSTTHIPLNSSAGAIYYMDINVPITSSNDGECCNDKRHASIRVDLKMVKAPILYSLGKFEPYIVGGRQTKAYGSVAAILLDGKLHCTGTVVGLKTILTAAHCLYGYEGQVSDMEVLFGSNLLQPASGPFEVGGVDYPKGEGGTYEYNPETMEDDIGVVYLTHALLDKQPYALHSDDPQWKDILDDATSLYFVGYGYDVIEDQKFGLGVKREASWGINGVSNRRFTFKIKGKNTCKGDSGGPAFYFNEESRTHLQVGITSGGDNSCTEGFDTRVDAYQSWLQGKVN